MKSLSTTPSKTDIAVAAGASITMPMKKGYQVVEGMIYSASGNCRPYSAMADGTVDGTGCAALVLKRLSDAERDGDDIWAVIKGSACNNDGRSKMHFTAPGVEQLIQKDKINLWQLEASQPVDFTSFGGDHFYIHDEAPAIARVIERAIFNTVGEERVS